MILKLLVLTIGFLAGCLGFVVMRGFTFSSSLVIETGLFTLGGALVGGLITGIVTYITAERQNTSEERRLSIQFSQERSKALSEAKRICYAEALAIFGQIGVAVVEGKNYPESHGEAERQRYHTIMSNLTLLAGEEVNLLRKKFHQTVPFDVSKNTKDENKKMFYTLKEITAEIRIAMRKELGIH